MEQFHRGERLYQTQRLKQNRKQYWGRKPLDTNRLGAVAQTPCICSCFMCSPTTARKMTGNSVRGLKVIEQSALQLLNKESLNGLK